MNLHFSDFAGPPTARIFRAKGVGSADFRRDLAELLFSKEKELQDQFELREATEKRGLVSYWKHYNLLEEPWPAARELRRLIQIFYFRYLSVRTPSLNSKLPNLIQCWGNIDREIPVDEKPHRHNSDDRNIVGVYYVGGDFANGNGAIFFSCGEDLESRMQIHPTAGTMLFFPPTLPHGKAMYLGKTPRMSIAFDIRIEGDTQKRFIPLFSDSAKSSVSL